MAPVNQAVPSFSDDTLNRVPARALKMLGYIGRTRPVFAVMQAGGFTQADLQEGWALLHATAGYVATSAAPARDEKAAESLAFLDAWDEPNFRRLRAAVRRKHPQAESFLFDGISPGVGTEAIISVSTLLDRVDRLARGPHAQALATLEARGLTPQVRAELREHITIAKGVNAPAVDDSCEKEAAARHRQALVELKMWFDDWAETARTAKLSRFHLIHLGLAKPKKAAKKDADADEDVVDELDEELAELG